MRMVQWWPPVSAVFGAVGLVVLVTIGHLSPLGVIAGVAYLAVSNALLARGLRRSHAAHLGPANLATLARSTLVGLVTALVATSLTQAVSPLLLVALAGPALALDAVDGWLARRTGSATELGARFDMEVDAYLLLVLSIAVAPQVGWWAITIGALRYLFVAAGWLWPWMTATLPPRYWRKVVTAATGIGLIAAASQLLPVWTATAMVGAALLLLLESFGRDVIWLVRAHRRVPAPAV
jgi:phosphatidylglycerophosphate synthase